VDRTNNVDLITSYTEGRSLNTEGMSKQDIMVGVRDISHEKITVV